MFEKKFLEPREYFQSFPNLPQNLFKNPSQVHFSLLRTYFVK